MKRLEYSLGPAIAWLLVLSVLSLGCPPPGGDNGNGGLGPQAAFDCDVREGDAPLTVQFTDYSSRGGTRAISWMWDFGDGGTSRLQNPSHRYQAPGDFTVSLRVTSPFGRDVRVEPEYIQVFAQDRAEETILLPGGVPLEMVWVSAGSYLRGRYPGEEDSFFAEEPQHPVTLSSDFWMGKYAVLKGQWEAVMNTRPWHGQSSVLDDPNSPAVHVTWQEAQEFVAALNTHIEATGQGPAEMRLPTEAEWEYVARAGTETRFYWGDDPHYERIDNYAWYRDNAHEQGNSYAHGVGQKLPNSWGFYDMGGNVWEWCEDGYDAYPSGPVTDPVAPHAGLSRVLRGGGWTDQPKYCRSACRYSRAWNQTSSGTGFRLVR